MYFEEELLLENSAVAAVDIPADLVTSRHKIHRNLCLAVRPAVAVAVASTGQAGVDRSSPSDQASLVAGAPSAAGASEPCPASSYQAVVGNLAAGNLGNPCRWPPVPSEVCPVSNPAE